MDGLKKVCVYYGQTTLSYSELNEYSFNQQLVLLAGDHHDEEYMGTGDTRVRIDENIKLCVMPMQKEQNKASSRITEIVFR